MSGTMALFWLCSVAGMFLLPSSVRGARILIVPLPSGSHIMTAHQIGEALVQAGHEVDVITDPNCKSTKKLEEAGMTIQGYNLPDKCKVEREDTKLLDLLATEQSIWKMIDMMKHLDNSARLVSEAVFPDEKLFKSLKSRNYDLCIVDGLKLFRILYLIPYKLGLPIVSFLAVFNPKDAGVPGLPSFTPMIQDGKYTDEMNFFERLSNMLQMFVVDDILFYLTPHLRNGAVAKYVPEKPYKPINEIISSSVLWLVLNDIALDFPRVNMPHVVDIGGLNTRPANPLPDNFQKLADAAVDGLVIVSFGAVISGLSGEISVKLLNDLSKLKQTVIWRHDGKNLRDVPPHVKLVNWMPQNDLLAHPNTKVFVTHCGANGQFEALYHGVPMVGVPLFGDQIYNAKRLAKNGLGVYLTLKFQPGELHSAIEEVLKNDSYKSKIALRSKLFKDRPMTPKEVVVHWVEHIIKYGSDHLVSVAVTMPWYKYWCFDILCSCLVSILLLALILYKVAYCLIRLVCKLVPKKHKPVKSGEKKKKQ